MNGRVECFPGRTGILPGIGDASEIPASDSLSLLLHHAGAAALCQGKHTLPVQLEHAFIHITVQHAAGLCKEPPRRVLQCAVLAEGGIRRLESPACGPQGNGHATTAAVVTPGTPATTSCNSSGIVSVESLSWRSTAFAPWCWTWNCTQSQTHSGRLSFRSVKRTRWAANHAEWIFPGVTGNEKPLTDYYSAGLYHTGSRHTAALGQFFNVQSSFRRCQPGPQIQQRRADPFYRSSGFMEDIVE